MNSSAFKANVHLNIISFASLLLVSQFVKEEKYSPDYLDLGQSVVMEVHFVNMQTLDILSFVSTRMWLLMHTSGISNVVWLSFSSKHFNRLHDLSLKRPGTSSFFCFNPSVIFHYIFLHSVQSFVGYRIQTQGLWRTVLHTARPDRQMRE